MPVPPPELRPQGAPLDPDAVVVGVDFGTLSGRAMVVRVRDGAELASAVHAYPHAVMERELAATGQPLPPDWALQVPGDYVAVLRQAVPAALAASGARPEQVVGIGTDATACTVLPTLADGTPLCEVAGWSTRPHAYPKLWKHHAAQPQANRLNALAAQRGEAWLGRYGGRVSSEWEFAKALQVLEEDPEAYAAMQRWVELSDWVTWQLCGQYWRNASAAGYKALRQDGAYPSREFLAALDPAFAGFVEEKVEQPIAALGARAGGLSARAAAWTGLPEGIAVSVGNIDAHVTAPAARATGAGQMLVIMGTSTCHVLPSDVLAEVPGMCGVVDGGLVEGLWGYEAGQSAVGDIFGWFVETCVPGSYERRAAELGVGVHELLTDLAAGQEVGQHGLVALDWHGGNRSVLVDHELSAVVVGQTLATRPEDTYRALMEATAFGTRVIIEAFEAGGVPVAEVVVAGGLVKNALLMQIYADVTRKPLSVIASSQGGALGAAISAAVAAGAHPGVHAAVEAMGAVRRGVHVPDETRSAAYDALYAEYLLLHDHFGRGEPSAGSAGGSAAGAARNDVLHRLRAIRRRACSRAGAAAPVPRSAREDGAGEDGGVERGAVEQVAVARTGAAAG